MLKLKNLLKDVFKTSVSVILVIGLFYTCINDQYHNYKSAQSLLVNERNYILDTYNISDFTLLDSQIESSYFEVHPNSDRNFSENVTCISGRNIFHSDNDSYFAKYNVSSSIVLAKTSGKSEYKELDDTKAIFEIKEFYRAAALFFDESSTSYISDKEFKEIKDIIFNIESNFLTNPYSNDIPIE